jgi:hexosaminidase
VPIAGEFGPIDPTNPSTWTFLSQLFTEVAGVFPDAYIHIGGDEVSYECWESNPQVVAWMAANNIASFEALESYYVQRVITLVDSLGKSVVGWQEIFDNNLTLPSATVVTAWKGGAAAGPEEMAKITTGGFRALLSAGWYENYIAYVRECASLKKYPH